MFLEDMRLESLINFIMLGESNVIDQCATASCLCIPHIQQHICPVNNKFIFIAILLGKKLTDDELVLDAYMQTKENQ